MPALTFSKYQGLGNDFVLVDARESRARVTSACATRLCDRRRGIGADGVITLLPTRDPRALFRMHIFNSDGSEAEMCGNGLRCVVRLALRGAIGERVSVDTDAGPRRGWLLPDGRVRVTLGTARLLQPDVAIDALGHRRRAIGVSMGNPHLVLEPWPEGTDLLELARTLGPTLEHHALFPDRTNVGFLAPTKDALRLVVFERGVGITEACGTGAAAAAVAARRFGVRDVSAIDLPGGRLEVAILGDPMRRSVEGGELGEVEIAGEADHAFDGVVVVANHEIEQI